MDSIPVIIKALSDKKQPNNKGLRLFQARKTVL